MYSAEAMAKSQKIKADGGWKPTYLLYTIQSTVCYSNRIKLEMHEMTEYQKPKPHWQTNWIRMEQQPGLYSTQHLSRI